MKTKLRILIVEDSPDDANLVLAELRRAGFAPEWKCVTSEPDFLAEINLSPDIILSDYALPHFNGLRAAELLQASGLDIPFILISGTIEESVAVDAMKHGVSDYLLKDRLTRLGQAVEHALAVKKNRAARSAAEAALREREEQYRKVVEASPDGIFILQENRFVLLNKAALRLLGATRREELIGRDVFDFIHPDFHELVRGRIERAMQQDLPLPLLEEKLLRLDGSVVEVEVTSSRFQFAGQPALLVEAREISERKQAEAIRLFLAETSSGTGDEPFFNTLARYLAGSLHMDFVCIDRLEGDGLNARTLAVWCDGKFEDNVTYALKDTPCGDVVGQSVCCFPANVCQFFPRDTVLVDLRAESYVGVTLWSHTGQPIGLIAVIGRGPLADRAVAEATLKLVAVRAASELERQQAEVALRASEEKLRQIVEHSAQLFYSHTPDNVLTYVSPQTREFFDLEASDALRPWTDFLTDHPVNAEGIVLTQRAFETGERQRPYELELRSAQGRKLWVEVYESPVIVAGKTMAMVGALTDITKRKQAIEALRASEAEFRTLAEAMPQMVWITRPDGWNIYFSQQWTTYTGLTLEESLGHGWNKPFHPDDQQRAWDAWQAATTQSGTYSLECRLRRADGEYRWWLIRGVPLRDAAGKILKWFGTCTDIHDNKLAAEELHQQADELQARNDELTRFNRVAIGREVRMIELKREVNELCRQLGKPARHRIAQNAPAALANPEIAL